MPCSIITQVEEIVAAYQSLRERCAPDAPTPSSEPCVVPLLLDVIRLAKNIADGDYGITETVSKPTVPACLMAEFLADTKAWIEGMTCGVTPGGPTVYLWFISERETETWSIRLRYDGSPYGGFPGFEDGSGAVAWFNSVPTPFAQAGAHVAELTASFPEEPETWEYLFDTSYSRWLLQIDWGDRIKYFVSRSSPSDADNIAAYLDIGIVATFEVVGSVSLSTMMNTWTFTLPENALERD